MSNLMNFHLEQHGVMYFVEVGAMANSSEISEIERFSLVRPIPDMFFPHSRLKITLMGVSLDFTPTEAISCCRVESGEGPSNWTTLNATSLLSHEVRRDVLRKLRVQQAESWWATRTRNNVRELTYDHDWTFTSSYWGSIQGEVSFVTHIGSDCIDDFLPLGTIADTSIPLCTFKEVDFWEDELDDNGCSKMGLKLRVTEKYFYILMRFELRLDNVLSSRSLETRIYHELGSSRLLREFKWVEAGVEQRQHRVNQVIRITS